MGQATWRLAIAEDDPDSALDAESPASPRVLRYVMGPLLRDQTPSKAQDTVTQAVLQRCLRRNEQRFLFPVIFLVSPGQ